MADLNRSFIKNGSFSQVVTVLQKRCYVDYCLDFHVSAQRLMPQIRIKPETKGFKFSKALAPFIVYSKTSKTIAILDKLGIPMLLFEGGKPMKEQTDCNGRR